MAEAKKQEDESITDAAQAKADALGVDIDDVEGTGAEGRITVGDVEAAAPTPDEPADDEPKFPVEQIVRDSYVLTGHRPHVMAGALEGSKRKELNVKEAKSLADKWLRSDV